MRLGRAVFSAVALFAASLLIPGVSSASTSGSPPRGPSGASYPPSPPSPPSHGISEDDQGFAGYIEQVGAQKSTAAYVVPAVRCDGGDGYAYFEASIYGAATATESGVQATCTHGKASYAVRYDVDGRFFTTVSLTPGDLVYVDSSNQNGICSSLVDDQTKNLLFAVEALCSRQYTFASAGVLTGGAVPDFGTVILGTVQINDKNLNVSEAVRRNSVHRNTVQVTQGDYSSGSFVLTWVHS
jgi:hypothetical protein